MAREGGGDYLDADDVAPRRCSMYLKTVQGVALKYLFEVLKDIFRSSLYLEFGPSGVRLSQGDSSMTAMVQLELHADEFEEYHCPEPLLVVVDPAKVARALKGTKPQDTAFMFVRRDEENKLCVFRYDSASRRVSKTALTMKEPNPKDNGALPDPETDYCCSFTAPSELLQTMFKDLDSGESEKVVALRVSRQEGDAQWRVSMRYCGLPVDQQQDLDEKDDERGLMWIHKPAFEFACEFKLKYLLMFCKAQPISKMLEVRLMSDGPEGLLCMVYKVASMGSLTFIATSAITDAEL